MKMLIIALVLQASSPTVGEPPVAAPAAQAPAAAGDRMSCHYDQARHARICINAQGEELRCRREQVMGSRMPVTLCTTAAEDAAMERDSRDAIQKYQTVTTPDQG